MLPPVSRVRVELEPLTRLLDNGSVLYKVRIAVESASYHVVQELMLNNDDFESRFDKLFEMAKRTPETAIEREAKTQPTESFNGEAKEGDAAGIHA